MNPVPHAELWLKEALPLMTEDERREELAYYRGENNESFHWNTSFREIARAGPPQIATVVMLSTIKQCESSDDICGRTYDVYTAFGRALAASIPSGRFVSVEAQHDIYRDDLDAIVMAVASLPKRIPSP